MQACLNAPRSTLERDDRPGPATTPRHRGHGQPARTTSSKSGAFGLASTATAVGSSSMRTARKQGNEMALSSLSTPPRHSCKPQDDSLKAQGPHPQGTGATSSKLLALDMQLACSGSSTPSNMAAVISIEWTRLQQARCHLRMTMMPARSRKREAVQATASHSVWMQGINCVAAVPQLDAQAHAINTQLLLLSREVQAHAGTCTCTNHAYLPSCNTAWPIHTLRVKTTTEQLSGCMHDLKDNTWTL